MEVSATVHMSKQVAEDTLRTWQEENILTAVNEGDLVLAPILDRSTGITEYLWFEVVSKNNRKW